MRNSALMFNCSVALSLLVGVSGHAMAQTAAPATPAASAPAAAPAAPPPSVTPTASETPPAQGAAAVQPSTVPAVEAAPTAPPAATTAETPPASYFRIDHDYAFGLQLWAGATHPLGEGIGLATDIYIAEVEAGGYKAQGGTVPYSWYGEFDIGPAFTFGPLSLTPMVGIGFDWGAKHVNAINGPQLYTILNTDKIYVESWIWTLLYSPFKEQPLDNYFHTRDWILYKLSGTVALGPQIELWTNLQDKISAHKGVTSLPIGGHVDLAYGTGNTLGVFLGYEANKYGRESRGGNAAVGRLTFVHNF